MKVSLKSSRDMDPKGVPTVGQGGHGTAAAARKDGTKVKLTVKTKRKHLLDLNSLVDKDCDVEITWTQFFQLNTKVKVKPGKYVVKAKHKDVVSLHQKVGDLIAAFDKPRQIYRVKVVRSKLRPPKACKPPIVQLESTAAEQKQCPKYKRTRILFQPRSSLTNNEEPDEPAPILALPSNSKRLKPNESERSPLVHADDDDEGQSVIDTVKAIATNVDATPKPTNQIEPKPTKETRQLKNIPVTPTTAVCSPQHSNPHERSDSLANVRLEMSGFKIPAVPVPKTRGKGPVIKVGDTAGFQSEMNIRENNEDDSLSVISTMSRALHYDLEEFGITDEEMKSTVMKKLQNNITNQMILEARRELTKFAATKYWMRVSQDNPVASTIMTHFFIAKD